ncbi:MAG TPA: NAD/NADP octopine/nopaline dehydrogenase family protein [Xanthobacteraceae bacterium]|nr:NAD/NADP octopine/nopaline dehydrogenase family protein [Xanthobacteraceae bacterium]
MRVAIMGAGAIGFGGAACLARNGHEPVIWSPSGRGTAALATGEPLVATGVITGEFRPRVAASCAEALADAEAVLVALPGNAHRLVFDAMAPHLSAEQIVLISGHLSFGALYLARLLAARNVKLPIVAWGTTVTTGRKRGAAAVHVNNLRQKVDIATVPLAAAARGLATCQALFGDCFVPRDDLMAIAVSNLNPQNHLGIALCNLTRMERGERWSQNENVTDAVGRLMEALDAERLAIAAKLGVAVRTIREHYSLSFNVAPGPIGAMARQMHARGDATFGPTSLDTRYVLEDVPYGLVPPARLGRLVEAPARLHEAGIAILSAAYGRDLAAENDLLPAIGFETLSLDDLRRLAREG